MANSDEFYKGWSAEELYAALEKISEALGNIDIYTIPCKVPELNQAEAEVLEREMWGAPRPSYEALQQELEDTKLRNFTLTQAVSTLQWEKDKLEVRLKDIRRR